MCEAVKVKHKLYQMPQDIVEVRNTGHKLRKSYRHQLEQDGERRGWGTSTTGNGRGGSGLHKLVGTQILPPRANTEHRAAGFVFALWDLGLALVQSHLATCYKSNNSLVTPFSKGHVYSA